MNRTTSIARTTSATDHTPEIQSLPEASTLARAGREIGERVQFELYPVLAGLSLLTNAVRVLRAVSDHAKQSQSLHADLRDACPSWSDPLCMGGDRSAEAVVSDLARYAADLCAEVLASDETAT